MVFTMRTSHSTKIILCVTADYLLAGTWNAGKLQMCRQFINDAGGYAAFSAFLQQYPSTPIYLIADALEEDYRVEHLPHTTGAARRALLARKLNQCYRGLQYRTAQFARRDTDKRQDDHFLFAAISNEAFIAGWVGVIQQNNALLTGVYLLPMISRWLIDQGKLAAPHILLYEHLSSGLRQTYFHNGHLSMSRLVPNIPAQVVNAVDFYLTETEKMRLYLMSKRLVSMETQVHVVVAGADTFPQQIPQILRQEQGLKCVELPAAALAKTLGLAAEQYRQHPELLHMQLLAGGYSADNLAPEKLTEHFRLGRLKRLINLGTYAVALLGTALCASTLSDGFEYRQAYADTLHEITKAEHRYKDVAKHYPVTSLGADDLRQAVIVNSTIDSFPKSPRRMMQVLSAALENAAAVSMSVNMDNIHLQQLNWLLSPHSTTTGNDKTQSAVVASVEEDRAAEISAKPQFAIAGLYEIGILTAEIHAPKGNYQAARDTVHHYVQYIKADGRVAYVEVIQEPVNLSSFAALQGSTADVKAAESSPVIFKLKIMLKPARLLPAAGAEQS